MRLADAFDDLPLLSKTLKQRTHDLPLSWIINLAFCCNLRHHSLCLFDQRLKLSFVRSSL